MITKSLIPECWSYEGPDPSVGIFGHLWMHNCPEEYVVSDSHGVEVGQQCPILGKFDTEQEAAEFIGTLPDYLSGRYNLDGPNEEPSTLEHLDDSYTEGEGANRLLVTVWTLECSCGATVTVRDYDYYPDFPEE